MDRVLKGLGVLFAVVLLAVVVAVCFLVWGFFLGVYYTFHPHPEYRDHLF